MLLSILHLHLPMSQALALLLRFGWIGRMHERGATDTVADRCAVQKMHTAFPHSANMKIGIFHQPDRWVKAVQACQAFTPVYLAGGANGGLQYASGSSTPLSASLGG